MDIQLVRIFRQRWQAVAAVETQERRAASVALRWQQLNAILRLSKSLGLSPRNREVEEQAVRGRWAKLKQRRP